jgi:hypothetical protein
MSPSGKCRTQPGGAPPNLGRGPGDLTEKPHRWVIRVGDLVADVEHVQADAGITACWDPVRRRVGGVAVRSTGN